MRPVRQINVVLAIIVQAMRQGPTKLNVEKENTARKELGKNKTVLQVISCTFQYHFQSELVQKIYIFSV